MDSHFESSSLPCDKSDFFSVLLHTQLNSKVHLTRLSIILQEAGMT